MTFFLRTQLLSHSTGSRQKIIFAKGKFLHTKKSTPIIYYFCQKPLIANNQLIWKTNNVGLLPTGSRLQRKNMTESHLIEADEPRFIATIEKTRTKPAGSRNLFEVTLSSNGKISPCEGQLLITEANCSLREDGCIFVRSALSTVENGKILAEILNLGQKDVKMGKT